MSRLTAGLVLLPLTVAAVTAAADPPTRADKLKAARESYVKARDEFGQQIRAGAIKPDADGDYPGWADLQKRAATPFRELVTADPADPVALNAITFVLYDLGQNDPGLYDLAAKHHLADPKLEAVLGAEAAPPDFLRVVAAKSPHAHVRLWATYHLGQQLYVAGKPKEAEAVLDGLSKDAGAKELGGYTMGTLADTAGRLLFEVRRLNVGQEIPELAGADLDGKPLKLSEYRGKVTLVVFWATWCGPCMQMVPHERALAERYAKRPFAVVGVNGDVIPDGRSKQIGADGKEIDHTARVKAAVEKNKITWRSFRSGQSGLAADWNVRAWPTVYLIDHKGAIRGKWKGDPGKKVLDAAVAAAVKAAEPG